jgi:PAS domain S-box-containing protein
MSAPEFRLKTDFMTRARTVDLREARRISFEEKDMPDEHPTTAGLEESLQQAQRRQDGLQTLIDTIPTFAWRALPDGSRELFNKYFYEYTGLGPEEALGRGCEVIVHPGDIGLFINRWREILDSGEPGEWEARLRRFDGEYR